jgi:hypothetical protein
MNYLIFRSPGYPDMRVKPGYDCFIIFPDKILSLNEDYDSNVTFEFTTFECINLGLSFEDILKISDKEWELFREGCLLAASAAKSRSWVSNINIAY